METSGLGPRSLAAWVKAGTGPSSSVSLRLLVEEFRRVFLSFVLAQFALGIWYIISFVLASGSGYIVPGVWVLQLEEYGCGFQNFLNLKAPREMSISVSRFPQPWNISIALSLLLAECSGRLGVAVAPASWTFREMTSFVRGTSLGSTVDTRSSGALEEFTHFLRGGGLDS